MPTFGITIDIDYTYDLPANGGTNFFGAGNPQGAAAGSQALAALEAAAGFFSNMLDDTFSAITVPPDYESSVYDTVVSWFHDLRFTHPSTGAFTQISAPTIAANQYIIYAGARGLSGATAGRGGPGGYSRGNTISGSGNVTFPESDEIDHITHEFFEAVDTRGETSGFSRWGGSITFDTSARTWHYNHTTPTAAGTTDFYSVAIHELAHALGFGERDSDPSNATAWENEVSGSSFFGSNAISAHGGSVPLYTLDPDPNQNLSHWAQNTTSTVYGTATSQEAAMDPDITNGTRKMFTTLDAAAMKDIGWTVVPPAGVNGDYNDNGIVDAADYVVWRKRLGQSFTLPNDPTSGSVTSGDYTVWRTNFGRSSAGGAGSSDLSNAPEPSAAMLALLASAIGGIARRRRFS
jgi:hypothetical protein